jgi:hypothetical protein
MELPLQQQQQHVELSKFTSDRLEREGRTLKKSERGVRVRKSVCVCVCVCLCMRLREEVFTRKRESE